jgi:hypothetical protein
LISIHGPTAQTVVARDGRHRLDHRDIGGKIMTFSGQSPRGGRRLRSAHDRRPRSARPGLIRQRPMGALALAFQTRREHGIEGQRRGQGDHRAADQTDQAHSRAA